MLGEPPRTPYDLRFSLLGIPVRVHPLFWLAGFVLGPYQSGGAAILIWMVAFFLGILCHELGHAIVIRGQGGYPWITLYMIGGITSSERARAVGGGSADGWRQILVSAAGPAAGFLLAAAALVAARALGYMVIWQFGAPFGARAWVLDVDRFALFARLDQQPLWIDFVNNSLFVTIVYGIFNLLPIYPLDGGQIAREILVMLLGRDGIRHSLILSMFVSVTLAAAAALFWHQFFLALFFAYFAFSSYTVLQAYLGSGPW